MGNYAQLFIDRLYLSWKNYVPTFLTFLFSEEDFYSMRSENDDYFEQIGYRTSREKSLSILNEYGYTVEFFAEVYDSFYKKLFRQYEESAKSAITEELHTNDQEVIHSRFQEHIHSFPKLSRDEELRDFIRFLSALLNTDFKQPPFNEPVKIKLNDGREYLVASEEYLKSNRYRDLHFIDYESMQMYLLDKELKFPPWVVIISSIFDEEFFFEYPEIISLMFVRLVLEAVSNGKEIRLELSDIIEDESEVKNIHSQLVTSLVDKVNLYNQVFKTLFVNEDTIRNKYIKVRAKDLLESSLASINKHDKGRLLEDLVEVLFTSNRSLELIDKRVSTGDEEIDLVVKNNIDRPFWLSFGSPLLFIECKNWSKSAGSTEIRDFETKLRNHSKLVKIGFFVSINGFTSEAYNELKRAGRDSYHIVLLHKDDIREYITSDSDFFAWLERKAAKFY